MAWTGFGLIEILGRYRAVQGTVILMPMPRGVSVSTVADSAWCRRNTEDRKDRTEGTGHAEPVSMEKKEGPTMGMEWLPTALQRRQPWGGFAVFCLS